MQGGSELIIEEWTRAKEAINSRIPEILAEISEAQIQDVTVYILEGGKRFRGFLTLTMAQATGGTVENAMDAALAIELVHSASLALDDMADMDTMRRGKPSAWVAYSTSRAALASLLLIAVAQRRVEQYGFEAIKRVIRAWEDTVRGEILDAYKYESLDSSNYLKIIEMKTASLFRLSAELGAIAAGSTRHLESASRYGTLLGLIYQITDDMVDYIKHSRRGRLDPTEKLYRDWIKADNGDLVTETKKIINSLIKDAVKEIEGLPESRYKAILVELPRFVAVKMIEESGLDKEVALS